MAWLDWVKSGDEYVGGRYAIRLIEPYRWQVLRNGQHLLFEPRLSLALRSAEDHYREQLRRRDFVIWTAVLIGSVFLAGLTEYAGERFGVLSFILLATALFGSLGAIVRLYAAFTRNPNDPYRRRAPWERRSWWQRVTRD